MEQRTGIVLGLILLLVGCEDSAPRSRVRVQISPTQPTVSPVPTLSQSPTVSLATRDVKVQVTIDTAADLRVVAGTDITVGQILADRYSVKQRLANQRQLLAAKLQEIQQSDRAVFTAPQLEQAKIELQTAELELKDFSNSRRWTSAAYEELPQLTEAEAQRGRLLEERYQQAQQRFKQLETNFKTALAEDKRQKNLINKEIATIDAQIERAGVSRSSYAGTIKDIKLVGLPGKEMVAEITIAVPNQPNQSPQKS